MSESVFSPGIDPPSPTLSVRLRELADYLAAPAAGRLTEEQRALSLGIARRLVHDVAARLDPAIDPAGLWDEWLRGGLPCASRLAGICFARAEEHRWREQSAQRTSPPPAPAEAGAPPPEEPAAEASMSDTERAYLALRIADRRRFDALGNPALAIADLDADVFRGLLLDIAAWRLAAVSADKNRAAALGDAVRAATAFQASERGITHAGTVYAEHLGTDLPGAAAIAIDRHDWPTLVALAAAVHRRSYDDMALALLTAETASLPSLLAPLRLDHAALAPLEASLAMLPARAVGEGDHGEPAGGRDR
ncbi:MAG: hypothetical protein JHC57_11790 [Sphingopyxis sp.]|uniref:hypothetical protein n=1 Tax=Sphingopyxis sp. TaxID=1908224 RepID=UPI001A2ED017|nr:hypothetical protein [Sphingopyxis sp.]MBJ7500423.1 hypothetical protein [Sphingopyxis sp.]